MSGLSCYPAKSIPGVSRLPSPRLWLEVLQKIEALGNNTVSFCVNWDLLEGKPGQGEVLMDNVFDLQPFIDAAVEDGLKLIA